MNNLHQYISMESIKGVSQHEKICLRNSHAYSLKTND